MMRPRSLLCLAGLATLALGCRQDMHDQPRFEPLEKSRFFDDQRSARPQVPGTIARGELSFDDHLNKGLVDGQPAETFPFPITMEVLERGRERYDIFCSVCHDRVGTGQGMAVRRGMKQPTSFHVERLLTSPPGYFFDVITRGFGAMYDYSDRITPRDRWSIVAYLRTLQYAQGADAATLPNEDLRLLEAAR